LTSLSYYSIIVSLNKETKLDLTKYYAEICKQPMLSKKEEQDLFKEFFSANVTEVRRKQIKDKIIQSNLRFVFKTAKAYSKNHPEYFEELICAGNEGLIAGFEKFDPNAGIKFLSYAGWWVTQRILKEMSRVRIVSLPIWKQQLASKIQRIVEDNEKITLQEIKDMLPDVKEKDIEELFHTKYLTYYIEDMTEDSSFEINPIEDEVEKRIEKDQLINHVMGLQEPYRTIIVYTFGLHNGEAESDMATAKKLGMKKDEFKRAKEKALAMLKEVY